VRTAQHEEDVLPRPEPSTLPSIPVPQQGSIHEPLVLTRPSSLNPGLPFEAESQGDCRSFFLANFLDELKNDFVRSIESLLDIHLMEHLSNRLRCIQKKRERRDAKQEILCLNDLNSSLNAKIDDFISKFERFCESFLFESRALYPYFERNGFNIGLFDELSRYKTFIESLQRLKLNNCDEHPAEAEIHNFSRYLYEIYELGVSLCCFIRREINFFGKLIVESHTTACETAYEAAGKIKSAFLSFKRDSRLELKEKFKF
jgi:hypothetical protein